MSESVGDIFSRWILDTSDLVKLNKGLEAGTKETRSFTQKLSDVGNIITGFRNAVGIVGDLARGFKNAGAELLDLAVGSAEFTLSVAEIKALGVEKSIAAISREVSDLSVQFGQDAQNVNKAYYDSLSAGIPEEQVKGFLQTVGELATISKTDMVTANNLMTSSLNAFGIEVKDAAGAADVLFGAVKAGKTTIGELDGALGKVAPLANAVGVGLEEVSAALAATTKGGLVTAESVTGLKATLQNIIKPSKEASETAQKLGIDMSISALESKGFSGVLLDMIDKTKGNSEAMTQLFGSVEAYNVIAGLAKEDGKDFIGILDGLKNSSGNVAKAFDIMSEQNAFGFRQMKAMFELLKREIGDRLQPAFKLLIDAGKSILATMIDWVRANKEWIETGITNAVEWLIDGVKSLWQWIQVTVESMGGWGQVTEYVKGVIAGAWKTIAAIFKMLWGVLGPGFKSMAQWMGEGGEITKWGKTWMVIKQTLSAAWSTLSSVFGTLVDAVKVGVGTIMALVTGDIGTIGELWSTFTGSFVDRIMKLRESLDDTFGPWWDKLNEWITDKFTTMIEWFHKLYDKVSYYMSSLVDAVTHPLDTVKSAFNSATGLFRRLFGESIWPEWFKKLANQAGVSFSEFKEFILGNLKETASGMEQFTGAIADTTSKVTTVIGGIWDVSWQTVKNLRESINSIWSTIGRPDLALLKANMQDALKKIVAELKRRRDVIEKELKKERETIVNELDQTSGALMGLANDVKASTDSIKDSIDNLAEDGTEVLDDLADTTERAAGSIADGLGHIARSARDTGSEIAKGVKDMATGLKDVAQGAAESVTGLFGSLIAGQYATAASIKGIRDLAENTGDAQGYTLQLFNPEYLGDHIRSVMRDVVDTIQPVPSFALAGRGVGYDTATGLAASEYSSSLTPTATGEGSSDSLLSEIASLLRRRMLTQPQLADTIADGIEEAVRETGTRL